MKSLVESIFSDNITNDPFDTIIDHLDIDKYSAKVTIEALDQLFEIGGKKYGFYSTGSKKADFLKAIQKNNWVMLLRKNNGEISKYAFEYPRERNNGFVLWFYIDWCDDWCCDDLDFGWAIDRPYGATMFVNRAQNMHYEECILITDRRMIDAIKKKLKELTK